MSFQINLSDRSKASARFIRRVHREIQKAFARKSAAGMTQQGLASKLEVNRATVNKRLAGRDNLTLRSIADLAWALDTDIVFRLEEKVRPSLSNVYKPSHLTPSAPKSLIAEAAASPSTSSSTFKIRGQVAHHVQ